MQAGSALWAIWGAPARRADAVQPCLSRQPVLDAIACSRRKTLATHPALAPAAPGCRRTFHTTQQPGRVKHYMPYPAAPALPAPAVLKALAQVVGRHGRRQAPHDARPLLPPALLRLAHDRQQAPRVPHLKGQLSGTLVVLVLQGGGGEGSRDFVCYITAASRLHERRHVLSNALATAELAAAGAGCPKPRRSQSRRCQLGPPELRGPTCSALARSCSFRAAAAAAAAASSASAAVQSSQTAIAPSPLPEATRSPAGPPRAMAHTLSSWASKVLMHSAGRGKWGGGPSAQGEG